MNRTRSALALVALLLSVTAPSTLQAGGFSNLDFGIRRMGMRAITAHPDDPTAVMHNVAGLTFLKGTQLYTFQSVIVADTAFRMYDTEGNLQPDHDLKPTWNVGLAPFFSVVSDLNTEKLRVALSLFAPNAYGAMLPKDEPTRYHVTEALFLNTRLAASMSWDVTKWMTVGFTVNAQHIYLTARRVMNPYVFADPDVRFQSVEETAAADGQLDITGQDFSWSWDVGLLFRPTEGLYIGGSFFSGNLVTLRGKAVLENADGSTDRADHRTQLAIPFIMKGGVHWEITPDFEVGFDVTYWHYQVHQEQRTELSQPLQGLEELVSPTNYSNSWMWSVGVLCRVIPTLELMLGYQKDYTPIPNEALSLENPTRDSDSVSVGLRWQVTERVRIGFGLSRTWFALINNQVSIGLPPTNAKGHGGTTFFAAEVGVRI